MCSIKYVFHNFYIKSMKENIIIIVFVTVFSYITTPLINENLKNNLDTNQKVVNIAIADNFWDYISRFSINN